MDKTNKRFSFLIHYMAYKLLPRKLFIKAKYRYNMGKKLNINNPQTFNEKIQWLKLYWNDKKIASHADKYLARGIVKEKYSYEILNEIYGVYKTSEEIDFNALPQEFVLKVSSGCGFNIICKDKSKLDICKTKRQLDKWLKNKYWIYNGEWVYSTVKPVIICEKLIKFEENKLPEDYKFFCFNGEPKFMFIASDRGIETKFDFFDMQFKSIPVKNHYPNSKKKKEKPKNFEKMIEVARKLSKDLPFVRIDLYSVNNKIIFGEFTFFHFSGTERFEPEEYDYEFGKLLDLSLIKNIK